MLQVYSKDGLELIDMQKVFASIARRTSAHFEELENELAELHAELTLSDHLSLVADLPPSLREVLGHEGGNDDDKHDPGGRTSRGILQSEWRAWCTKHRLAGMPADVWQAPQEQIEAIYKANYWDALHCDQLPAGVDYAVFDYGIHSGIARSARALQTAIGADVDGIIGNKTLLLVNQRDGGAIIGMIDGMRMNFLRHLKTWGYFGKGWQRRVQDVDRVALHMWATYHGRLP